MAWGDVLAGLGGAMQGGLAMHQTQKAEEYRRQRDEQIDDLKKQLAEMKGSQALEQIEKRNVGKMALQHLVNVGKLDVQRLDTEGDAYLEELHQQGRISLEEKMQIGRMSLAERNNAASQKRVETQGQTSRDVAGTQAASAQTVAGIHAGASMYGSNQSRAGQWDIANLLEGGRGARHDQDTALGVMNAQSNAARARAALQRAQNPWGTSPNVTGPTFEPSQNFSDIMKGIQGQGQAPFQGASDPGQAPATLGPPPPQMSPAAPAGTLPSSQMWGGGVLPPSSRGGIPEARLEEQARALARQIQAADRAGNRQEARRLRAQAAELLKPQP